MVKPVSIPAIEAATETSWQEWCAFFQEAGAQSLDHNNIVKKAQTFRPISGWWAQGVAVAYEQHIGRRKPGERSNGSFSASVSRTIEGTPGSTHAAWCKFAAGLNTIDGQAFAASPMTSRTPKWYYWRGKFEDQSSVVLSMAAKDANKVRIAVEHQNLTSEALIQQKKHAWATLLSECFS